MKEVAIVSAVRTAIGKAGRGSLRDVRPDAMAGVVVREAFERSGVGVDEVEDLILGCAMPEAEQGMNVARIAGFLAGLPETTSAATINRFCSSGLHAVSDVAKSIMVGQIEVGIGGGVESMSMVPMGGHKPSANPTLMASHPAVYTPMGITAENVAKKFEITREQQDEIAFASHQRALKAQAEGWFKDEIVPIEVEHWTDDGKTTRTFDTDEGPRADTTLEALAKLRSVFDAKGTVTAGNASQVSDGAAAVVLMDAAKAKHDGREILGYFRSFVTAGVPPEIMGIGPVPAVRKLLERHHLTADEVGVIELNEAFASQAAYCMRELGLDHAKVNPKGGAISLGHPLGCTGARQIATLLPEMKRTKSRYGIATMCIGGGMGAAGLIEIA
jgi:acetyl-CoA acyltransferase